MSMLCLQPTKAKTNDLKQVLSEAQINTVTEAGGETVSTLHGSVDVTVLQRRALYTNDTLTTGI